MTSVLSSMLTAASKAAGPEWGNISADLTTFAKNLIQDTADTAANLASGKISKAVAQEEFDMAADYTEIVAQYGVEATKIAAQSAFNAASDALWTAIRAAIP